MTSPRVLPLLLAVTLSTLELPIPAGAAENGLRQNWSELAIRLQSGDQVIAELFSGEQVIGAFVRIDGSELVVWVAGDAKRFLREEIRTVLRVRASRRRGMILGGAIVGATVGLLMVADQEDFNAGGRLLFASIGAGAGAGIGAAFSKKTTRDVLYRAKSSSEALIFPARASPNSVLHRCRSTVRHFAGGDPRRSVTDTSKHQPLITDESIASFLATSCGSDSVRGRGGTSLLDVSSIGCVGRVPAIAPRLASGCG